MATITHLPSEVMDEYTFVQSDADTLAALREFGRGTFAVTHGVTELRDGSTERLSIVWGAFGAARIVVGWSE